MLALDPDVTGKAAEPAGSKAAPQEQTYERGHDSDQCDELADVAHRE